MRFDSEFTCILSGNLKGYAANRSDGDNNNGGRGKVLFVARAGPVRLLRHAGPPGSSASSYRARPRPLQRCWAAPSPSSNALRGKGPRPRPSSI
jgi:hypothetical protein